MKEIEYLNGSLLLQKYGFTYEEIVKIIDTCSFSRVENDSLGIILDNGCKYFINKGYTLNEIRTMVKFYPRCLIVSDGKRKIIEDIFLDLGMTWEEFKKMTIKNSNIYSCSKERVDEYINFFKGIGFNNKEIVKVFKYVMFIFRSSVNNFKKLCNDMKMLGFNDKDIYMIAKSCPSFWTHNISKINNFINTFNGLGFDFDEIKTILRKSPSLIGYGDSTIIYKFNELIGLGFSKEELKNIILEYPTIINIDIERTREIIEFFKGIGLYDSLLEKPKYFFMQGIESSYARYCFYIDKGKEISKNSYIKLFCGWKRFERLYGIGIEELIKTSPYSKDKCKK